MTRFIHEEMSAKQTLQRPSLTYLRLYHVS